MRINLTWFTHFSLLGCYTRLLDPGVYTANPSIHEQGIQQENQSKFLCLHVAQEVGTLDLFLDMAFLLWYFIYFDGWAVLKSRVYVVVQE